MKTRGTSSSVSSSKGTKPPHFLMGLLGREAETYADAYLVSQEGKRFPVVRSLLAMKCSFFKEKFFPGSITRRSRSEGDPETEAHENYPDDTGMPTDYTSLEGATGTTVDNVEQTEGSTAAATAGTSAQGSEGASVAVSPVRAAASTSGETPSTKRDGVAAKIETFEASRAPPGGRESAQASVEQGVTTAAEGGTTGMADGDRKSSSLREQTGHTKPRYPMPFPMILLKQVVEFVYTDSVTFLDDIEVHMKRWRGSPNTSSSPPACQVVSHIVELARAADYVQLKELCLRCCIMLRMVVKAKRSSACAALGAIRRKKDNPFFLNKMASLLVKYISGDVKKSFSIAPCSKSHASGQEASCECFGAFGLCTVMHLDSDALEEIICAQARGFSDEYMLQTVYFWATGGKRFTSLHAAGTASAEENVATDHDADTANSEDADSDFRFNTMNVPLLPAPVQETPMDSMRRRGFALVYPNTTSPESEARFAEGKEVTSKFNLSEMNPSFLHEYVENSGLVDKETLYNVYRYRALSGPRFPRIFSIRKRAYPPRLSNAEE